MIRRDFRTREEVIAYLRAEMKSTHKGFIDFHECRLTENITRIVDEITNSAKVDRGLVLLGLLASAAGLDQGKHIVVNKQAGEVNKLSILILGAGETGSGKSTALKPFLDIIHEIQPSLPDGYQDILDAMEKRKKKLQKDYANSGNEEYLNDSILVGEKLRELQNIPKLLTNDTSIGAYNDMMEKQGFVFRMEPDGEPFKPNMCKLLTKAWSDEGHSEARISRKGSQYKNSAIIDLVYTQPIFFYEFTHDRKNNDLGLLARTLCYFTNIRDDKDDLTPKKSIDKGCLNFTKNLLKEIYTNAFNAEENIKIYLDNKASELLDEFINKTNYYIKDGLCDDIKGWASRAAQHAVKLAGIIYILESEPMARPYITDEYMITAINIVKILMNNLDQYIREFSDDKSREITCKIGIMILEENLYEFRETEFKQRIKSKYKAEDVDTALRELEYRGIISRYDDRTTREKRRGRPAGNIYINNYHSLLTGLNLELPGDF